MSKPRAKYRNEMRTRVSDEIFTAVQHFKTLTGIDSDSAAVSRLLELQLFGVVGTLPAPLNDVRANLRQVETA